MEQKVNITQLNFLFFIRSATDYNFFVPFLIPTEESSGVSK